MVSRPITDWSTAIGGKPPPTFGLRESGAAGPGQLALSQPAYVERDASDISVGGGLPPMAASQPTHH